MRLVGEEETRIPDTPERPAQAVVSTVRVAREA